MKSIYGKPVSILILILLTGCAGATSTSEPVLSTPRPTRNPVATESITVLPNENRPNFLIVLTDDLDARLGTLDNMHHVKELLIDKGTIIRDYFVSDPTCCPSRASILRGQYTHSHLIYTSEPADGFGQFYNLNYDSSTVATWLQAAGYRTIYLGKYLNGYPLPDDRTYVPQGWDEWYSPARGKPYVGFNYTLNENGLLAPYGSVAEDYLIDILSKQAEEFLRNPDTTSEPFFMFVAPFQPHEPAEPAQRHSQLFLDLTAPRTPSFNEADVRDKPGFISLDPLLTMKEIDDLDYLFIRRVQSMQSVDEMVERLLAALEDTGELKNTYIIFTSDNGFHLGQHRMKSGKSTPYEEDINVPFIIRGPGIASGRIVEGYLSGNVDISPTLADLAGIVPPAYIEGRSLVPLFDENPPSRMDWRQAYLIEYYSGGFEDQTGALQFVKQPRKDQDGILEPTDEDQFRLSNPTLAYQGLRTTDHLYVEYNDGFVELYDLKLDPFELENIASNAEPDLLARFSTWLEQYHVCKGAVCLTVDRQYLP